MTVRRLSALLVALALLTGCQGDVVYVPVQPPPASPPVVQPPPPPPPADPPPAEGAAAALEARIIVGASASEVVAAVGRAPDSDVPASQAGPQTLRWIVTEGADVRMVYAVMRDGKVASKGISKVEVVR